TYNSNKQRVELQSLNYGSSNFVQVEDVDGTNNILRGALEEQKTAAAIDVGTQFSLVAKEGGVAAEKITILFEKDSVTSTPGTTNMAMSQDTVSGAVNLSFRLADEGDNTSRLKGAANTDREITTTLADIKNLVEANATLSGLVDFKLKSGASLTDTFKVDNTFADSSLSLVGGASGADAVKAKAEFTGTSNGRLTLEAKTAGAGGNDINVVFGTGAEIAQVAKNYLGSAAATSTGFFSGLAGNQHFFNANTNTLFMNFNATFADIVVSLGKDSDASDVIEASFSTGSNLENVSATEYISARSFSGGAGITGGRTARTVIDLSAGAGEYGIQLNAKDGGSAGNGVEFIIRHSGSNVDTNSISVIGNKIIYTASAAGATGTVFATSGFAVTSAAANLVVRGNSASAFHNQFNFRFLSGGSSATPSVSYDTTTKMISVTYLASSTTLSALATAIDDSEIELDTVSKIKLGDVFTLSTDAAAWASGEKIGWTTVAGYATGLVASSVTAGDSATVNGTIGTMITALRGNAAVRELVDIELYAGLNASVSSLAALSATAMTSAAFTDAVDVFGDYRFVLTGGFDGDVLTNSVATTGTDGSVKVNGVDAAAKELSFTFDNGDVRGTITIDESMNAKGKSTEFAITSKGSFFQTGQKGQLSYQTGIALRNISVNALGKGFYLNPDFDTNRSESSSNMRSQIATLANIGSGSAYDLTSNPTVAINIIDKAINDVSTLRGQIGAFISNTLDSNINSLGVAFENLVASESQIRDVDFAQETAEFTRAQILVQAGTSIAAQANVATQAALQLLG
ncbi:MAG: hypothetical protein HQL31_08205, partial [Planctomycetes bacterium]|nr:hypothetical protein [Planctomycetota bacterium]